VSRGEQSNVEVIAPRKIFQKIFQKPLDNSPLLWYNICVRKGKRGKEYGKDEEATPRGYPQFLYDKGN
jgi:hypothetical protein